MSQNKYPLQMVIIEERADIITGPFPFMEPVLFAYISESMVMKAKVSQLHPLIQRVANEWQVKLSTVRGFRTVQRIVVNSVKNN